VHYALAGHCGYPHSSRLFAHCHWCSLTDCYSSTASLPSVAAIVEVVRTLLEAAADVEAQAADGWRPLHSAAYSGCAATIGAGGCRSGAGIQAGGERALPAVQVFAELAHPGTEALRHALTRAQS
jgi:hypothetical protein